MSTSNKWNQIGEDIMNSVIDAVDSGNLSGLSQSIGDMIGEAADSIGRGIDHVGKEIERQAKLHEADIKHAAQSQNLNRNASRTSAAAKKNTVNMTEEFLARKQKQQRQLPVRYKTVLPGQAAGPVCLSVGIVGASMFGVAALATAVTTVFTGLAVGLPVGLGIAMLPFLALIKKGAKLNGRNRRFRNYVKVIGNKGYCAIADLARATGRKVSFVRKDLEMMINKGYFLEGHIDEGQTTLIVDKETYQQYEAAEEARMQREKEDIRREQEKAACPEEVQKILVEGEAYIRHIHECNDAIPGEEISAKLAKLEDIMGRIFAQVKKQPDSADELHKFMTYYLPTTTKLIDAYRDLDAQPAYGTNVANTKKEIEDTLDTINEAFENLFDSLFEDTAWDISSDISAMKVMLQQEGLTNNNDFK